jgi:hypothetical protein
MPKRRDAQACVLRSTFYCSVGRGAYPPESYNSGKNVARIIVRALKTAWAITQAANEPVRRRT